MLRKITAIIIVALLISMLSATFVGCTDKQLTAESIITVEADAHIEMMVDKNSRVINANAINENGEVLLVGEKFDGELLTTVVKKIVLLAKNLGYINNLMQSVSVDTISIDKNVEVKLNRQLFDAIKSVDKKLEVKTFNYKIEERNHKSFIRNNKGFENFSFLQYRLISNIIRYDSMLTVKQAARLSVPELTVKLLDKYTILSNYHTYDIYRRLYSEGREYKRAKANELTEIIGGDAQKSMSLLGSVITALNKIIAVRLTAKVPDALAESILTKLDVPADIITHAIQDMKVNEYGYIVGGGLDLYIDKMYISKVFINADVQEFFDIKIDDAKQEYNWEFMPLSDKEIKSVVDLLPSSIYTENHNKLRVIEDIYILIKMLEEQLMKDYNAGLSNVGVDDKKAVDVLIKEIANADSTILEKNNIVVKDALSKLTFEKKRRLDNYANQ